MKLCKIFCFQNSFVVSLIFVILIFGSLRFEAFCRSFPSASFQIVTSKGEFTQENFVSIQEAINEAENGSTIYVPSGIYYEHVVINKTISLVGENVSTTIIDGSNIGTVIQIDADNVSISRFTIQNSGWGWYRNGIYIYKANNCEIKNNFLFDNCHNIRVNCSLNSQVVENTIDGTGYGIRLINSVNCTAVDNHVSNCIGGVHLENATNCVVRRNYFTENDQGIRMYSPCTYNIIVENTVYNNTYDGMIEAMPGNITFFSNSIFHNNFIDNRYPFLYKASGTIWDDSYPSGGNYWSRYNGTDQYKGRYQNNTGSDGLGDTPYVIDANNQDHYPLMSMFHSFNISLGYSISVVSNSTIEDFQYFESNSTIKMLVSNMTANQTYGFCRLTIPHNLLAPPYNVTINDKLVPYTTVYENDTTSIIYFSYEHSTLEIIIVPEFWPAILLLTLIVTTFLCALTKRLKRN